jgi:1-pyrroline-5-carboxylate dehydrogenase
MHFVHPSANVQDVINHTIRGAFEYQGQKCSACSRLYAPASLWEQIKQGFLEKVPQIIPSDGTNVIHPSLLDFSAFMGPVINKAAYEKITKYIDIAKKEATILVGGSFDDSIGYFIHPTILLAPDPAIITLREEIFGPVLTCLVYPDAEWEVCLREAGEASPYGLTAAFFATDSYAIERGVKLMRHFAGNLYINDKCTAAVVGKQPAPP